MNRYLERAVMDCVSEHAESILELLEASESNVGGFRLECRLVKNEQGEDGFSFDLCIFDKEPDEERR